MIHFKAESNTEIGSGHLMRAIVLANEFRSHGEEVSFIFSDSPQLAIDRVKKEGYQIHQIAKKGELNFTAYNQILSQGDLIIFDTDDPRFYSGNLILEFKDKGIFTACFTITDEHFVSTDYLINPNIISEYHQYKTADGVQLLTGLSFMVLRKEFQFPQIRKKNIQKPLKILLVFGGADLKNLSTYFLEALLHFDRYIDKLTIVTTELNQHLPELQERTAHDSPFEIEVKLNVEVMSDIYQNTDLAITSAGTTMWEMGVFGIPQLVVASSEREKIYAKLLDEKKYVCLFSCFDELPDHRMMTHKLEEFFHLQLWESIKTEEFSKLVDGLGAKRIVRNLLKSI